MKTVAYRFAFLHRALMLIGIMLCTLTVHATTFIKDVKVIGGTKDETKELKETLTKQGWTFIDYDLNKGASGDYIYLLYKAEENTDGVNWGYITDFIIHDEKDPPSSLTFHERLYHKASYDGGEWFVDHYGDLNSNSSGDYLYLYYTKEAFPDYRAVTSITFDDSSSDAVRWSDFNEPADLNKGCGSGTDYIYMHFTTATAMAGRQPEGALGSCTGGLHQFTVSGYAYDPDAPTVSIEMKANIYKSDGTTYIKDVFFKANGSSDEFNATNNITGNHGFSATIAMPEAAGTYKVEIWAMDYTRDGSKMLGGGMQTFTITGTQPSGRIDVCNGGEGKITLSGWAYDPDATTESIGVQVKIYKQDGTTLYKEESFTANRPRDDVNNTYHITGQHGYSVTIDIADAGTYKVKVYAVDHNGDGNPQIGSTQTVTVTPEPVTVTIGNGTRAFYNIPFFMECNYSMTEQIYTAEEIGMAGTITSIAFQYASSGAFSMSGVQIYLKHTDKNDFGDYSMVPLSEEDKVFEGTFSATDAGWATIIFDTPFEYDGNGNLLVCCYDPTDGNLGTDYIFYRHDPGSTKMIQGYSNKLVPSLDGANWVSSWGVSTETSSFSRNNIRFNIFPGTFSKPENLNVSSCTEETATLTWTAPATGNTITGYGYQFKKTSDSSWPAEVTTTATTATFSNLTADTDYDFRVRTLYGSNMSSYQTFHFTTATSLPYEQGFENGLGRWGMVDVNWGKPRTEISAKAKHDGENGFMFYPFSTDPKPQYLISPRFADDVPITVLFYYMAYGHDTFQVGYSTTTSDVGAFTWGEEITSASDGQWKLYEKNFPVGTKFIAVKYINNYSGLYLDDFTFMVNYGPKPTGLAVKNCTEQEATLKWDVPDGAWGYAYQYKKASDASWSAEVTTTATTATISGLTLAADYEFRVKTFYGSNPSAYATLSFTTAVALPYAYGFEDGLGGWTETDCYISLAEPINTEKYTGICSGITHSGEHGFAFSPYNPSSAGDHDQYLISPRLPDNVPIGLTFYCRNGVKDGTSYHAKFQVGYSKTTTDISAFTWDDTMTSSKDWKLVVGDYPEGTKYVAIKWLTGSYFLYLDDIRFTRYVDIYLTNSSDNTATITENRGTEGHARLSGRTLYRDGSWNTLCLPFSMTAEQVAFQLNPTKLMTLRSSSFSGGTLTLNFTYATSIEAGKPYIIKWDGRNDYSNPIFVDVTIPAAYTSAQAIADALIAASCQTDYVDFIGTFSPFASTSGLLLDSHNTDNGAFHAALSIETPTQGEREFIGWYTDAGLTTPATTIPFAEDGTVTLYAKFEDNPTDVPFILYPAKAEDKQEGSWYTIDGRLLEQAPTAPGLYMHNSETILLK